MLRCEKTDVLGFLGAQRRLTLPLTEASVPVRRRRRCRPLVKSRSSRSTGDIDDHDYDLDWVKNMDPSTWADFFPDFPVNLHLSWNGELVFSGQQRILLGNEGWQDVIRLEWLLCGWTDKDRKNRNRSDSDYSNFQTTLGVVGDLRKMILEPELARKREEHMQRKVDRLGELLCEAFPRVRPEAVPDMPLLAEDPDARLLWTGLANDDRGREGVLTVVYHSGKWSDRYGASVFFLFRPLNLPGDGVVNEIWSWTLDAQDEPGSLVLQWPARLVNGSRKNWRVLRSYRPRPDSSLPVAPTIHAADSVAEWIVGAIDILDNALGSIFEEKGCGDRHCDARLYDDQPCPACGLRSEDLATSFDSLVRELVERAASVTCAASSCSSPRELHEDAAQAENSVRPVADGPTPSCSGSSEDAQTPSMDHVENIDYLLQFTFREHVGSSLAAGVLAEVDGVFCEQDPFYAKVILDRISVDRLWIVPFGAATVEQTTNGTSLADVPMAAMLLEGGQGMLSAGGVFGADVVGGGGCGSICSREESTRDGVDLEYGENSWLMMRFHVAVLPGH